MEIGPFAELDAMKCVAEALEPLDDTSRSRVIRWAADRYEVKLSGTVAKRSASSSPFMADEEQHTESTTAFDSAAELLAAAGAKTDTDKALVIGYWFQEVLNQSDLESQAINTELKHIGHGVGNITRALGNLMNQKPQLAIQLRKAGSSRQARKKYKLTAEGVKKVASMITANSMESDDD